MFFYFYITLLTCIQFFWLNGCGFFFGMHSYVPATSCLALLRIIIYDLPMGQKVLDTVFLSQELASGKPDSEKIKMLTEKINALLEQVRQHVYIFEDSGTLGLLAVVTFF